MRPEALALAALLGGDPNFPEVETAQDPTVENWAEIYANPQIPEANCQVDLSNYPTVQLLWPEQGPKALKQEPVILIGERLEGNEDFDPINFEVTAEKEIHRFHHDVDIVLAVDISESMDDNASLTAQILEQVKKHNPDSRVHTWTVPYDDRGVLDLVRISPRYSTMAYRARNTSYGLRDEEDHVGALNEGLRILEENDGSNHQQHVVLLTDEGDKRSTPTQRAALVQRAQKDGVKLHVIYDNSDIPVPATWSTPRSVRSRFGMGVPVQRSLPGQPAMNFEPSTENFDSLVRVARASKGEARAMKGGRVPDIFRTEVQTADYVSMDFEINNPYQAGEREFVVLNGEGARCRVQVDASTIERAILEGLLPEPTAKASTVTESMPAGGCDSNLLVLLGIGGILATGRRKKDSQSNQ